MNVKVVVGLLALSAIGLSGCGKDSNNPLMSPLVQTKDFAIKEALAGSWTTDCQNQSGDAIGLAAKRVQYNFSSDSVERVTTYFKNNDCTAQSLKISERGDVSEIHELDSSTNRFNLNYKTVEVTPLESADLLLMNVGFCGIHTWAVGAAVDVTANTNEPINLCAPLVDKIPATQFDIFRPSGSMLLLGSTADGKDKSSEEKRPVTIDESVAYKH